MVAKRHIQLMAFSQMSFLDLAGPFDVFRTANEFSHGNAYEVSVVSLDGPVEMAGGVSMQVAEIDGRTPIPHTLFVPGGPGIMSFCDSSSFRRTFVPFADQAERIASVCTGAYALASASLLDGKHATTHWSAYDDFEKRFPTVLLERGPIFVNDGRIWTSAGVTAGIDLALALIEQDFGQTLALKIARHLVMFLKRPGDQSQFSTPLNLQSGSGLFADLHAWITANLDADLSVAALAARMKMSERSFLRHYRKHTEKTPSKVVEALRLEAARELLCSTDQPLKDIAMRCGFHSEATLLRRFSTRFGITPGQHRARFRFNKPAVANGCLASESIPEGDMKPYASCG